MKSSFMCVLAPMARLRGDGAEHTLSAVAQCAFTPRHMTVANGDFVSVRKLSAVQPTAADPIELPLTGLADAFTQHGFSQYRIDSPELAAGTLLQLRVQDITLASDRRWKLQRRWPFLSRTLPVFQAAVVVLVDWRRKS